MFSGKFQADMYVKSADFGSDVSKLNNIYKAMTTGELPDVVFLAGFPNSNSQVLTITAKIKVTNMENFATEEGLVTFRLSGDVVRPSTYVVA